MVGLFSTASKESQIGIDLVQIRDCTLDTTEISPYFARFSEQVVFQGDRFDLFQLRRDNEADWKLLWDEIEIVDEEYPTITLNLVLSTLSTRKDWIGN